MKIFQKQSVAALIMVLAIAAGVLLAQSRKPEAGPAPEPLPANGFDYVLHNEDNALSEETVRYIKAVNASLFEQTGAQIVVDVVRTTGSQDITDYADEVFIRHGIGSRERNNGVLLVLALRNLYNGAPDGDYFINYGSGFSNAQAQRIEEIPSDYLEADFVEKRYDAGVQKTFDALVECMEDFYGVTVQEGSSGIAGNYEAGSGVPYASGTLEIPFIIGNIIGMLMLLFFLWILLDAFRYRRYRRRSRSFSTPPIYYPIFWGRPRPPRRPPPPPPPGGFGGAGRPPSGGFHGGGSLGGGAGRRPSGGFHSGGSLGGGAGRRPSGGFHSGGSLGGGAGRRPSGGFHRGGSLGGGARRGGRGRPSGGGRRR